MSGGKRIRGSLCVLWRGTSGMGMSMERRVERHAGYISVFKIRQLWDPSQARLLSGSDKLVLKRKWVLPKVDTI